MTSPYSYGGALTEESTTYVKRDADDQLFDALKSGKFCYVLESRQTGKSSLRVQIMKRLKEEGIYYFSYDLSKQGTSAKNDEEWYQDQIKNCISNFWQNYNIDLLNKDTKLDKVSIKLKEWWEARPGSNLGKYEDFLEGCLLKNIQGNIVFFIDEIDSVISLPFSVDDFFGFIRGCHEDRTIKKQYQRLTFCLMGVASPDKLIKNIDKTPFNFGTAVTLSPFPNDLSNEKSFEMMKPLLNGGLEDKDILQEILRWTGGQPFLTQKLCDLIVQERRNNSSNTVEEVVNSKIINNCFVQDEPVHLKTIQKRFDERSKDKQLAYRSLSLYKKILENQSLNVNVDNSQEESELKLSGLVLQQNNILKPYNPIYTKIFDVNWVEAEMRKIRLFSNELDSWKNEDERKKQLHLLYEKKYEDAKQWREEFKQYGGDDKDETNFIDQSSQFWDAIQKAFSGMYDYKLIIDSMNDWTNGFDDFNNRILRIVVDNPDYLTRKNAIGTLVEENIEDFKKYEKFQDDRNLFLNQDDSFELISLFEKISQKEPIPFDEKNPQHRTLKTMCFIILDKERNLRILNKIYEKILDQNWIKGVMARLRPYTKAFRDWQHLDPQESSDLSQNSSYLLQNNDLELALEWLGRKPTPKLEEGEIEFVMTSLVAEVWTTVSPSVQSEAISLITTFRPLLQEKDNYSDFLLREILQWTTSQTPVLGKLLKWVNESEIPIENSYKYLEFLVRSHIKNWSCQNLFDFALAPYSSSPEREREIFIAFDQYFLGEMNQPQIKETLQESRRTVDKYQQSKENDFQGSVLNFFKAKIARISFMTQQRTEQQKLDVLLDEAVTTSKGHLKSILIFELDNGLPLYHNKQLKDDDPALYQALFAEGGDAVGEAIEGFDSLNEIQEALDSFGDVTKFGNLIYSIFRLKEGTMMVYFLNLTISLAICFIAPDGVNLGLVVTRSQAKIKGIQEELENLGF